MKTALVTGGAGFIGSYLVELLTARNHDVYVIDNFFNGKRAHLEGLSNEKIFEVDIRARDLLTDVVKSIAPQLVFHLAASHFIPYCNEHPTETVLINIHGTSVLLDTLYKSSSLEKLFFASTAAVYSPTETAHRETDAIEPTDIYGATKSAGEDLVSAFATRSGVPVVIGRLFNAIGARETNPHLLPDVIQQLKSGSRMLRLGNLDPKRDFLDARDMAKAIVAAMSLSSSGCKVFNVGSGRQYAVREVVSLCELILGEKVCVVQEASRVRKVERPSLLADIGKIAAATGWEPQIDFSTTLAELLTELPGGERRQCV
jgi:UDP-glucose 4-epimerase